MNEHHNGSMTGIHLRKNSLKLIEVENAANQQYRINKIVQTKLNFPLTVATLGDENIIAKIGNELSQIFIDHNLSSQKVIFCLESPMTLIKKLPYDETLTEEELINQVDWEVKEFSYSPEDEYIVDFHKLIRSHRRGAPEMVVVSVREKLISRLKRLFANGRIQVKVIDLDVFAAMRAIEVNYDLREGEMNALIEVNPTGLLFTIIEDKEFYYSQEVSLTKLGLEIDSLESSDEEEVAKFISKELRRIILDNKLGENIENLNRIFLYGDMVKDNILENLQNSYNVRIDRANPFRRLLFAPNVSVDENIWSRPETFTVCVGSALRGK
ncbi:MAG: type IV pilus biogenesis protein PilM [Candidatus Zhuqueibacterota bacterium]